MIAEIEQLLSPRDELVQRIKDGKALDRLARAMVITILCGAAVFGAAIGCFRGGLQIAYAALKLPLVLLLTTAACAPALSAFGGALGRRVDLRRDLALVLSALARTSLTLAALTPLLLLSIRAERDYHDVVLLLLGCCAVAGLVGLAHFWRGLRALDSRAVFTTGAALLSVFALVGAQMSWTLRPYLVRPRTPNAPFVRQIEGNFVEAAKKSARSSAGIYDYESARELSEGDER